MKTFKDIKTFENKVKKSLCLEDYFKVDKKIFKIFEYGDYENIQYVYFYNKRTNMMIKIDYICPSFEYKNGIKIQINKYKFIDMFFENYPIEYLWRTDTL